MSYMLCVVLSFMDAKVKSVKRKFSLLWFGVFKSFSTVSHCHATKFPLDSPINFTFGFHAYHIWTLVVLCVETNNVPYNTARVHLG